MIAASAGPARRIRQRAPAIAGGRSRRALPGPVKTLAASTAVSFPIRADANAKVAGCDISTARSTRDPAHARALCSAMRHHLGRTWPAPSEAVTASAGGAAAMVVELRTDPARLRRDATARAVRE